MSADVVPMLAATEGTHEAVAERLYLDHREAVFRYLRAMTGDEEAALDLTAETFERAFRQLSKHEVGIGWLIRTARNAAIDHGRHSKSDHKARERLAAEAASARSSVGPDGLSIQAERARRVLSAVAQLPPPQREAIALRYSRDLTVREVAALIGKNESATQKLLGRGLARLKEMLDDLA